MATYRRFTSPIRTTAPHLPTLVERLRVIDPTIGVQVEGVSRFNVKRSGAVIWTQGDVNRAQRILDECPETSDNAQARHQMATVIDPVVRVLFEALLDEINSLRQRANLPAVDSADVMLRARAKIPQ